MKTKEN
jgi:hypothetical protein